MTVTRIHVATAFPKIISLLDMTIIYTDGTLYYHINSNFSFWSSKSWSSPVIIVWVGLNAQYLTTFGGKDRPIHPWPMHSASTIGESIICIST